MSIVVFRKLFVQLVAYADESGTNGLAPCVCGYIAPKDYWIVFCEQWKAVLQGYGVQYFHFRELNKSERLKAGNQYFGWSEEKADDFIHDLAMVIGRKDLPVPFGGGVRLHDPAKPVLVKHLYEEVFQKYFNDFLVAMDEHWPDFREGVSFCFEQNTNPDWRAAFNKVIILRGNSDQRIGGYIFSDRRDPFHGSPLQAADMFAYASRQGYERLFNTRQLQPHRILDLILCRNLRPKGHPFFFGDMNPIVWEYLINEFRARKKILDTANVIMNSPKRPYYPLLHHPYFQNMPNEPVQENGSKFEAFRTYTKKIISGPK